MPRLMFWWGCSFTPAYVKLFTALVTNAGNKLECLGCKPFQPSLMLVSKARAHLSEAYFKCSTLWKVPSFTHKRQTRLESLRVTNTLAYSKIINFWQKKFYDIGTRRDSIASDTSSNQDKKLQNQGWHFKNILR